jgi:hypothetical protein
MKSSGGTAAAAWFSGLPVADEDLVGAFGPLGCRSFLGAPLLVVVGSAELAVVAAAGRRKMTDPAVS